MGFRLRRIESVCPLTQRALQELDKECFPYDKPCRPEVGYWWVLWDDNKVAGYCGLCDSPKDDGSVAYLCRAGVMPEYRGRRLQRRLIKVRLSYAARLGYQEVVTDTRWDNVESSNSLAACGMKLYRPLYPWSYSNALYWYRKL